MKLYPQEDVESQKLAFALDWECNTLVETQTISVHSVFSKNYLQSANTLPPYQGFSSGDSVPAQCTVNHVHC